LAVLGTKKQTQSKPILFSPQNFLGVENEFEKTKPIFEGKKGRIMKKTGEKE